MTDSSTPLLIINANANKIKIVRRHLVPEFGPMTIFMLIDSIAAVLAIGKLSKQFQITTLGK